MNTAIFPTPDRFATDTKNNAGGVAYSLPDEHALAQLVCTGTFNGTYYAKAESQLAQLVELLNKVPVYYAAQLAVYARESGLMKDMPIAVLAWLSTKHVEFFKSIFPRVIQNVGNVRTFVQMIRSGVFGRKSLGTAPKKCIQKFLRETSADTLFWQSVGDSPSFADVLKLVHPKPISPAHDALFGYLIGRNYDYSALPQAVRDFEVFKKDMSQPLPKTDFRRLTALPLKANHWSALASNMTWNQARLNINTMARHGVFADSVVTAQICKKLKDTASTTRSGVLPFALWNTQRNLAPDVPATVAIAMGSALDAVVENVPTLTLKTLVLVDISGSMGNAITGERGSATTNVSCAQAAIFFATSLFKKNPDQVTVWTFDSSIRSKVKFNPRDSLESLIASVPFTGGSTSVSCGVVEACKTSEWDNIIIVSDNESWRDIAYGPRSPTVTAMKQYISKRPNAKLICWDLTPNTTTQSPDSKWCLNVGGYSDSVYGVIANFFENGSTWVSTIKQTVV